jgi:hypothetical protein
MISRGGQEQARRQIGNPLISGYQCRQKASKNYLIGTPLYANPVLIAGG